MVAENSMVWRGTAVIATNFSTSHLLGLFVSQGLEDPSHNVPYLLQGGLGMPDRQYYLAEKPQMTAMRAKYQAHIAAMLKLAGVAEPDAKAARVLTLEKAIAKVHATRTESEDVHTPLVWKREELASRAPGLDWTLFLEASGLAVEVS